MMASGGRYGFLAALVGIRGPRWHDPPAQLLRAATRAQNGLTRGSAARSPIFGIMPPGKAQTHFV